MTRLQSELVLQLTDKVSGPARGVGSALDLVDRKSRGFNGRMRESGRLTAAAAASMGRAQTMMVAGAGRLIAPVASAFSAAQVISSAADFETALTNIQKKAGTSAEQTAKLGEEIKALATSGELAVPIDDIAAAYERGAAAGIPVGSLKQFAALSVKAADGFDMSAEAVGNFAAKLSTGMKMSDKEVRETFDLVNSLADAGIADESTLVDFMDRTGASMKTLGLTKEQTLSVGATLLNIGMTSETAATGMDALSSKMLTVGQLSGKGRKTFTKYMGSVDDFAKLVETDANGALLKMLDRLQELNKTDRMAFLSEFVGQDHASKMLRLAEAVGELRRNEALAADPSKWFGSLDKSYKLKLDDFWSQWQIAKNSLEKLSIDLGTMGMPALKSGLQGAVQLVTDLDAGMKTLSLAIDWTAIDGAKQAVGELGTEIASLLNIDTSKSTLTQFFQTTAKEINAVANALAATADGVRGAVAFVRDPAGELRRAAANNKEVTGPGGYAATIDDAYRHMQSGPPEDASVRFGREKVKWEDNQKKRAELQAELDPINDESSATRAKLARQREIKATAKTGFTPMVDSRISILEDRLAELDAKAAEMKSQMPPDEPMPRSAEAPADATADPIRQLRSEMKGQRAALVDRSILGALPTRSEPPVPTPRPERAIPVPTPRPERPQPFAGTKARGSAERVVMNMVREPSRTAVPSPALAPAPAPQAEAAPAITPQPAPRPLPSTAPVGVNSTPAPAPEVGVALPTVIPQPTPVTIPVHLDTAAIEAEIARIEQRITDLSTQALDTNAAAAPGADGGLVDAMRSINDQLDALNKRRQELEQQLYAPQAAVPAPDIAGPVRAEGQRASAEAAFAGAQIAAALSITAKPTVDTSSMQAAVQVAETLARKLAAIPSLARQASVAANAAASVRVADLGGHSSFDGLHADIED